MRLKAKDTTQKMQTLSECIEYAQKHGYKENFKIHPTGLTTADGTSVYSPSHVAIENFYRFEGYSDPADNSILYLIQTSDWKKGILIDTYDTHADSSLSNFIRKVEEIHKKPSHKRSSWLDALFHIFKRQPRHSNA